MRHALALGLTGLLLLSTGCGGSSPEQLAKDMIAALEANDADKIRTLFKQSEKLAAEDKKKYETELDKLTGNDMVKGMGYLKNLVTALGNEAPPEMRMALEFMNKGGNEMQEALEKMGKEMMKGMEKMGEGMKDFGKGFAPPAGVPNPFGK